MTTALEIAECNKDRVGGVLRALREIVAAHGYVSREQEHAVAEVFNLSRAEVRGIVSFYHDLKTTPAPPLVVRICQAEACQAAGGRAFTRQAEDVLGVKLGEANKNIGLEAVYCLGLCAQGPSMMVNGRPVAYADVEALAEQMKDR